MKLWSILAAVIIIAAAPAGAAESTSLCVRCHTAQTPKIVKDWKNSSHAENGIDCSACHGDEHNSPKNTEKAKLATPDTCNECHPDQVSQYRDGKHALAWKSAKALPTTHWQPMTLLEGMEGCTGCHKIGEKSEEEIKDLRDKGQRYGIAACDSCHIRHLFSTKEASSPRACRTCHMGIDHPQWEMYSSSKHGVRWQLKVDGVLPEDAAAPRCQTCHMEEGDHAVMTGWGFLAVRLPMPEDKEWAEDRATVLKGLGILSPEGEPTPRLELAKKYKLARVTQEAWQRERDEMLSVCSDCHSESFAQSELQKGDSMIRIADGLMAQGIKIVAGLYEDGILEKPDNYEFAYPDLLTFQDAPTVIEQKLFIMFLKHRMRTFQGSFHQNPDYTFWYGWSEMQRDITEIKKLAGEMREKHNK